MDIITNKKAFFDYALEDKHEAGIELEGWEVKALRAGRGQLVQGYAHIQNEEVFLLGLNITPLNTTNTFGDAVSTRTKKLFLKKATIKKLMGKTTTAGYTLVVTRIYLKNGWFKCEVALGKGKTKYDKRATIKDRDGQREVERAMKVHRT